MLQAVDVEFGYSGTPVLRGVSLDVPDGGFVGILGPNGSGKTTLLKVLSGTLAPARGRVTIAGADLARTPRSAIARRLAVVPQETHLAFDYSVLEVVLMGRYPHLGTFEVEGPADIAIAREALAATGTAQFEQRPFATLSGGEKQRVVIASALAQIAPPSPEASARQAPPSPEASAYAKASADKPAGHGATGGAALLLLDEPTAALDLAYQLEISALLRDLQTRRPLSIVVSTHDLNFAAGLCRSLVLLSEGRVLASGPTPEVLTSSNIRALYGVEAEVRHHDAAGHLVVIPVSRAPAGARA